MIKVTNVCFAALIISLLLGFGCNQEDEKTVVKMQYESEPNNSYLTGNPIDMDGSIMNGSISSATDIDYYTFSLPGAAAGHSCSYSIHVRPAGSSSQDLEFRILNTSGGVLNVVNSNTIGFGEKYTLAQGSTASAPYCLSVEGSSGTGTTGAYTIVIVKEDY
jgi:hypothetical protein